SLSNEQMNAKSRGPITVDGHRFENSSGFYLTNS
ncbi:unnamed protein product, partial [Rotaria magnacalcarata]